MTTIDLTDAPRRRPFARFVLLWSAVALGMGVLFKLQLPHVDTGYAFINHEKRIFSSWSSSAPTSRSPRGLQRGHPERGPDSRSTSLPMPRPSACRR